MIHQNGEFFRVVTRGDISVAIPDNGMEEDRLEVIFAGGRVSSWLTVQEFHELVWEIRQELERKNKTEKQTVASFGVKKHLPT